MSDPINDVFNFHKKFELVPSKKGLLKQDVAWFRYRFCIEEINEWRTSHDEQSLVGCLDAMIDEVYVALGTLVMHGFSEAEVKEAWKRVHEANMLKERALKESQSKRGSRLDVIKPEGWVKPDLEDLCR
jgi:predicted HAD superfamily Cof-like phosphohydrolase